mmetsp:Transcript_18378/g.42563  ORF Transcript_18378/g.42563 Transcript_18378/m.42563 type:complete len:331 (+) Transcript_18378:125-1117(+)
MFLLLSNPLRLTTTSLLVVFVLRNHCRPVGSFVPNSMPKRDTITRAFIPDDATRKRRRCKQSPSFTTTAATTTPSTLTSTALNFEIPWEATTEIIPSSPSSPFAATAARHHRRHASSSFHIFCDLDGVLCDFDAGVRTLHWDGLGPDAMSKRQMWRLIGRSKKFYETLPWTHDGRRLWDAIRPYHPDILTGVPHGSRHAVEKFQWCRRELSTKVHHVHMAASASRHAPVDKRQRVESQMTNVITCWSNNKYHESGKNAVLIDDRISLAADWENAGGIFIHHTSTERTLRKLRDLGIICNEEEDEERETVAIRPFSRGGLLQAKMRNETSV